MIPFITSSTSTWRLLPPRLAGGINGSTCAHSSSVRSLGYRSALRSYRLRFFAVHIGDPSSNQATTLESQMIHWIQFVFGRTLRIRLLTDYQVKAPVPFDLVVFCRPLHSGLRQSVANFAPGSSQSRGEYFLITDESNQSQGSNHVQAHTASWRRPRRGRGRSHRHPYGCPGRTH